MLLQNIWNLGAFSLKKQHQHTLQVEHFTFHVEILWFLFLFCLFQLKELGVIVYDCSCLALDLHRIFSFYWQLQYRDYIPSIWSKRVTAVFSRDQPLQLRLNNTDASAYVSVRSINISLLCLTLWSASVHLFLKYKGKKGLVSMHFTLLSSVSRNSFLSWLSECLASMAW